MTQCIFIYEIPFKDLEDFACKDNKPFVGKCRQITIWDYQRNQTESLYSEKWAG